VTYANILRRTRRALII